MLLECDTATDRDALDTPIVNHCNVVVEDPLDNHPNRTP